MRRPSGRKTARLYRARGGILTRKDRSHTVSEPVTWLGSLKMERAVTRSGYSPYAGRGDWTNFERRPPAVRRFVTAFSGFCQPYLVTAARLGPEPVL
jgi:hypothetical protein